MTKIEQLIDKYYKPQGKNQTHDFKINPTEKHTKEYNRKLKKQQYNRHRHLILDELLNEIPFTLKPYQITQIRYWLDKFNDNFKGFHRNSSNETIILAFIMIQWKRENPKIHIGSSAICREYNLTNQKFELIQNRLIFQLMKTTELTYNQSKYLHHEDLEKPHYD